MLKAAMTYLCIIFFTVKYFIYNVRKKIEYPDTNSKQMDIMFDREKPPCL